MIQDPIILTDIDKRRDVPSFSFDDGVMSCVHFRIELERIRESDLIFYISEDTFTCKVLKSRLDENDEDVQTFIQNEIRWRRLENL